MTLLWLVCALFALLSQLVCGLIIDCQETEQCYQQLLTVPPHSDFRVRCNGFRSCYQSKLVVGSGSSLIGQINCDGNEGNCQQMELVVFDSNLTDYNLDCNNNVNVDSCDDMNLTLVNSSMAVACSDADCDGMRANLYDSHLLIAAASSIDAFANGNLQVYLCGDSTLTDDKGLSGSIDQYTHFPLTVDCASDNACSNQLITIPQCSEFVLDCGANHACYQAKVVVERGSTMSDRIKCDAFTENCRYMELEVFDSDLEASGHRFDCDDYSSVNSCDDIKMTLTKSTIEVRCGDAQCNRMLVDLYDSMFRITSLSHSGAFSEGNLQLYLYGNSELDDSEGLGQVIDIVARISQPMLCINEYACENDHITFISGSDFSLNCEGDYSCYNSTVVVESGCNLINDIDCDAAIENCRYMSLEVWDSDLEASGFRLDCSGSNGVNACDDVSIKLTNSKLEIVCSNALCNRMRVDVYDSQLRIDSLSAANAFSEGNLQLYLYGSSALNDDYGFGQVIDIVARISQPMDCSKDYACYNDEITFISGSDFSLKCQGYSSCRYAKVVVESGCNLIADIDCDTDGANCQYMTLEVYDSDLKAGGYGFDCLGSGTENSCDDTNLTLVRSTLRVSCDSGACDRMRVNLYDSTFRIGVDSSADSFVNGNMQAYLFGTSVLRDAKGLGQYLDIFARISVPMDCSSDYACENDEITFIAGSSFSLNCEANYACYGAKVVAESGTTLIEDIECDMHTKNCMYMQLEVYNSDLDVNGWKLDCLDTGTDNSCDDMLVTLVSSTLRVACGEHACDRMSLHLNDSQLTFTSLTSTLAFASGNLQVYLYGASALVDESGVGQSIDIFARISVPMDCSLDYACENDEITFITGSSFSLDCRGDYSCYGAKVVAESGTTLVDDIDCDMNTKSCMYMQLDVYNSDLEGDGWKLDCYESGTVDACDEMRITLVSSTLRIACSDGDCDGMSVQLNDSQLTIDSTTSSSAFAGNLQLYLYGTSELLDISGVLGQYFDIFARISVPMDCSSDYACENDEITFIAGSSFSLDCRGDYSCYNAKVVAESGTTLIDDIDCDMHTRSCQYMQLEVYDSDLEVDGWKVDCYESGSDNSCDDMILTLSNSKLRIACSAGDCSRVHVYLNDSELIIDATTSSDAFADGNLQVYLCGSSVLTDDKGMSQYIDIHYCDATTTAEPITTTTQKPITEKPTTEEPTTEKPNTEEPTTEETTTEETTTEESTIEASTTSKNLMITTTSGPQTTGDSQKGGSNESSDTQTILIALVATFSVVSVCLVLGLWFAHTRIMKPMIVRMETRLATLRQQNRDAHVARQLALVQTSTGPVVSEEMAAVVEYTEVEASVDAIPGQFEPGSGVVLADRFEDEGMQETGAHMDQIEGI